MSDQPIIKLNAKQVGQVYLDRMVSFFQRGIKPEEALVQVLKALAADVAVQRELTEEALSESAKYVHPKTGAGIIFDKKARIMRYSEEGQRDANELAELQAVTAPTAAQKRRIAELHDELEKDAANVKAVQSSLETDQANYQRWQERYEERFAKLKSLKSDYEALQAEGPALIAQIKDAQKAKEAADEDAKSKMGIGNRQAAQSMLSNLREQSEGAQRLEEAGAMVDEALKGEPTLDEEIAAREASTAQDDLINSWMSKAKK